VPDDTIGYVLTVYTGRGLPPDRSDFEDKTKAEKAFTDAKAFAILWQSRPPTQGLGWVKLKEKEAPPPGTPPAPPQLVGTKPAVPPVATVSKPPPAAAAPDAPVPPTVATEPSSPPVAAKN
jgi:hypothetical protein